MSKSKPRPTAEPVPSPQPRRTRRWIGVVVGLIVVLVTAGVWADWYYGLPADAQATFVGQQSCIQCHQPQHKEWFGSHHDLAMDRATDESVLGDFNNAELEHYGVKSRMYRQGEKFFIHTEGPDGQMGEFEIKYTFGVDPLQQYMVEFDRPADMPESEISRLQVLRVSWDTQNKRWFHLDPPDVREKLSPDDDLHWTGVAQRWNNMCADCHSTNLQKNFDVATATYHTTFSEIDVSCEACHGPGSLHVQLANSRSLFWDRKQGYALARLKGSSSQGEIHACAPCHSRRRVVQTGYTAGCNYYDYFVNELLPEQSYHADGQILDEVYEFGSFIQSKMYHKGVRCTDCHNPHTATTKFEGNKLCTSCHQHPAGKYDGFNHHRHPEGSTGASCVDCHMPQTTYMAVDPRRDHSLRIPRPDLSVKFGTPNACTGCHLRDKELPGVRGQGSGVGSQGPEIESLLARSELKGKEYADWLRLAAAGDEAIKARLTEVDRWADDTLNGWYGPTRKREPHFTEALHAAREQTEDAPRKLTLLLDDRNMPAIARATAALELGPYLDAGGDVSAALAKGVEERDPQIQAAAVMSLQNSDREVLFKTLVPAIRPERMRVVRAEAGRVLARVPQLEFRGDERIHMRQALAEAFAAAAVDHDRAGGHLMTGVLYESLDQLPEAEAAYRTAIRIEPSAIGPRANLSSLLERRMQEIQEQVQQLAQSGGIDRAKELVATLGPLHDEVRVLQADELSLLERDGRLVPENAPLQSRLGFLRYLQGWRKEAEAAFLTAHFLEPRSPDFAYSLAIYYRDTGRPDLAKKLVDRLVALRPRDPMFQAFADELRRAMPPGPAP